MIYVHKYIIFQLPLKDEKAVSGIESIVFNVVPFCRVITHLKEEVATDSNFEFSITCIALKLLCPFMNGGFMSYHLSILQTASATKIPPQILQIHVLLMASVAAQLILVIFIATSFC